jgi:Txe/YoeB family toxin of Txe-Axe toxin-antitoxin module
MYNLRNQKKATKKGTLGSKRTRNCFECLSEYEEPLKNKTSLRSLKHKRTSVYSEKLDETFTKKCKRDTQKIFQKNQKLQDSLRMFWSL